MSRYRISPGSLNVRFLLQAALCFSLSFGVLAGSAIADLKKSTSLGLVPADAAFYSANLRNRESYDDFMGSNACAKIKGMPLFQMGMFLYNMQKMNAESPVFKFHQELNKPENKQLIKLLGEMFASEVFMYGDKAWAAVLEDYMAANREMYSLFSDPDFIKKLDEDEVGMEVIKAMLEKMDDLKTPAIVIGCKIESKDTAMAQMKRLEKELAPQLAKVPQLKDKLTWKKIDGNDYMTLPLNGKMIPWDEVEKEMEGEDLTDEQRELIEKLFAKIKKLTYSISLGLHGDYLLLSMAPNDNHLANLGKGKTLYDVDELELLRQHADKPITSIGYVSERFVKSAGGGKQAVADIKQSLNFVLTAAQQEEEIDPELVERLESDIEELADDLKPWVPEPGARLRFSFKTERGYEGYLVNWTEEKMLDGSKPLSILEHVGGKPIFFHAAREQDNAEVYDLAVKWVKKTFGYVDEFAKEEMDEVERAEFKDAMKKLKPLFARIDKANREYLIPAFKDGQSAIVMDDKLVADEWCPYMPEARDPLPMLELGIVAGLSDAKALRKGAQEYYAVAREMLKLAKEMDEDGELANVEIPDPKVQKIAGGKMYYYPFPQEWKVDERLAPNAALSKNVLAMTFSPEHSERLLASTPLDVKGPVAEHAGDPLAAATYFDHAGFIDFLTPWGLYFARLAITGELEDAIEGDFDEEEFEEAVPAAPEEEVSLKGAQFVEAQFVEVEEGADEDEPAEVDEEDVDPIDPAIMQQVQVALDVLKCFRGYSDATYLEGDKKVTHFEYRFEDIGQ